MEFWILGPLEVTAGGERLRLGGPKQRAVLALLLLRANQAVATDWLVEELWHGRPPKSARLTLSTYLSHLRQELSRVARRAVLLTQPPGYLLEVAPDAIDASRFERLTRQGRSVLANNLPAVAASQLRTALGLWRGPVLADLTDLAAAVAERARLDELRLVAVEARIDADLALGQHAELAAELDMLIAEHPLREQLHAQRMLTLYRGGRQADALAAFLRARQLLADGLGIEPGSALRRLHQAILRQESKLDLVIHERSDLSAVDSSAILSNDPFVGRETETALLCAMLEEARAGQGRLVVLSGEPGIGKTRTARELARHARASGFSVLWGRAWEEDGAPVLWPWTQAMRKWVERTDGAAVLDACGQESAVLAQLVPVLAERIPGLPDPPPPESAEARFRLFDVVTRALRYAAGKRPTLLVLDDLHRADLPSLRLLQFLAQVMGDVRLMVVATYRDVAEGRDPTFLGVLSELWREPISRSMRLDGLRPAEAARYVELIAGSDVAPSVLAELHARTGGNPFYLRELVQLLNEAGLGRAGELNDHVPQGVLAAVTRRLTALPHGASPTLAVAAVVGRVFSLEVLEVVGELGGEHLLGLLELATTAGLITEMPGVLGHYRFSHELIRDALYATLSGVRRARLHRRVGEVIEKVYQPVIEEHLAELAHHFRQAGEPDAKRRASGYSASAGDHAMGLYAYEEAARQYALALDCEDEPERRCDLLLAQTKAHRLAGEWVPGHQSSQAAAALARAHNLSRQLAKALVAVQAEPSDFGVYSPQLVSDVERALRALGQDDHALRAQLMARLGMALVWAPSDSPVRRRVLEHRRLALTGQAVAMARELGDVGVLAVVLHARCYVLGGPEHIGERLALAEEIARIAHGPNGERWWELTANTWCVAAHAERGDFDLVDAVLEAHGRLATQLHRRHHLPGVLLYKGLRAFMADDLVATERYAGEALAAAQQPIEPSIQLGYGALLWIVRKEQGRLTELEQALITACGRTDALVGLRIGLALLYATTGRSDQARATLGRIAPHGADAIPRDHVWLFNMTALAEVCVRLRDYERATELYEILLPFAQRLATVGIFAANGPVALPLGLLAKALGRHQVARQHFVLAAEISLRIGARPWLARARQNLARC